MQKIAVYSDAGVDPHSLQLILKGLKLRFCESYILPVNRSYFLSHQWEQKTRLIIFPGGRDVPYDQALRGEANRRLKAFVEQGGCYLGICAGAYYGSSNVIFEQGGALEVLGSRELRFYEGYAQGPAYGIGQFSYHSLQGARIAQVTWSQGNSPIYFNGGCTFSGGAAHIIASYSDLEGTPPAAVLCHVGEGRAVLCGVHPEYDQESLPLHLHSQSIESARSAFWNYLLDVCIDQYGI